jgi:hypothetical protein
MILLLVTCVSLAIATLASAVAWRIATDEERRSAARVARLAEALHTEPLPPSNRLRAAGVATAVILAVSTITVVAVALSGGKEVQSAKGRGQTDPAPLELVALSHERAGDELTIRGTIRNPAGGAAVQDVTAVVFLYRANGALLTSTRAPLAADRLVPGAVATFVATADAADVARYRVSFRNGDRVLPHVDRRSSS